MNIHDFHIASSVIQVASDAGDLIRRIYEREADELKIQYKADDSPLTLADEQAHQLIATRLQALTPSIPILSEESEEIPYEERKYWQQFWLVDPLDGTKEFISRSGEFTVNIAVIEEGRPVLGCVHVPLTGETFFAAQGRGAFCQNNNHRRRPIHCDPFSPQARGLRLTCSRSHIREGEKTYMQRFKDPVTIPQGSALKMLRIADGKADVYPRFGPTMEWDIAAAEIILSEAGGQTFQAEDGSPLFYNKEDLYNPHFIACGRLEVSERVFLL
ncbi:MAG: 3'(2'),5'-bisphosphate nucleotidase CysQ [Bacteroidota bacterium]